MTTETQKTDDKRLFDIHAAVRYLKSIGADAATPWFVRCLITNGKIPFERIGRKHYVSRESLDLFLVKNERRAR